MEGCRDANLALSVARRYKSRDVLSLIAREESMKDPLSTRRLIRTWHKHEKATIDHLVGVLGKPKTVSGTVHSPTTDTGLVVEEQVRKAWRPAGVGLPIF
jgi:hypothetical protein